MVAPPSSRLSAYGATVRPASRMMTGRPSAGAASATACTVAASMATVSPSGVMSCPEVPVDTRTVSGWPFSALAPTTTATSASQLTAVIRAVV
jgi:hypothetical protein